MDFLERLWNISPDGGSGLTELLFLLVLAALVIMGIFCFARVKHKIAWPENAQRPPFNATVRSAGASVRSGGAQWLTTKSSPEVS